MPLNTESLALEMILHAGKAQCLLEEATLNSRSSQFVQAETLIEQAKSENKLAHKSHQTLLQHYSSGEDLTVDLLLLHAEDYVMSTKNSITLASELLSVYQRLVAIEDKIKS